jgi:cephalosporin hydroxylase
MKELRNIFDNLEHSSDKWEPYFEVYERHLEQYRCKSTLTLVEVGVQNGGSLEMWSRWFNCPNSKIIGIDIDPTCADLKYKQSNIEIHIADQKDMIFWDELLKKHPKIDVFIDDAGHYCDAQISNFEKIFPTMPIGSTYICEDVHTSYMSYNGGGYKTKSSFIEYAKNYVDAIHKKWIGELDTSLEKYKKIGKDLTSIHFYDSMVVFEKFGERNMQRVFPK